MVDHDVRHVGEPEPAVGAVDRHLPELLGVGDLLEQVPHLEPLLRRLDEPAGTRRRGFEEGQGRHDLRVAGGADDLRQGDPVGLQALGIDLDLELLVAHPPDGHVGHPGDAHEAWLDRPPGDDGLLDGGELVGPDPDQQHAAGRRERLQHGGWLGDVGQRVRLGQTFLDQLPGPVDVGAFREHHHDRRQARDRLRPDRLDPLDAVEQVRLQRHRDQLLDLLGRQPEGLGLHLGVGRRELGQDVDGCAAELHHPDREDAQRRSEDEEPEAQCRCNDRAHRVPSRHEVVVSGT